MRPTRLVAALVAALFAVGGATVAPPTSAQTSGSEIWFVHGVGPAPATVDLYAGYAGTGEWSLLFENVVYGVATGPYTGIAGGDYNLLLCNAVPDPAGLITACPSGSLNQGNGTALTFPATGTFAVAAVYGGPGSEAPGRPTLEMYGNDVSCVPEGTTRLGVFHGANAGPVDVLIGDTEVFTNIAFGASDTIVVPALGATTLEIRSAADGSTLYGPWAFEKSTGRSLNIYFVGDPQQTGTYETVVENQPLPTCDGEPAPTTTSTSTTTPSTSTSTPTTTAVLTTATPRFTG